MRVLKLGAAALALSACALMAELNVVVTNIPQKVFVEKIGGKHVDVESMVPRGASPHTYKPKPSQMMELSRADIYFTIGIEFEDAWLSRLSAQNKTMRIEKMHAGVPMPEAESGESHEEHGHEEHGHEEHGHHHHHEGIDPHSWLNPSAVEVMAKNILEQLKALDAQNSDYYTERYESFIKEIEKTDAKIAHILEDVKKGTKFMVFHPGFGHFAHAYDLKQVAIEVEGKEPKPKMLARLIEEARHEGIRTVITSPEFSDKAAKTLAKEIGGSVAKVSPVAPEWSENLIKLAKIIANDNAGKAHADGHHEEHHHDAHEGHAH